MPDPVAYPDDPTSPAYREAVMASWRELTGRERYDPEVDEAFELDPAVYLPSPYPYCSGDPVEVGRYLGAVAWLMRTIELPPGARIVEFGAGWGHLALGLAATGYEVTAVDLNRASVGLLRERADRLGVPLRVLRAAFLDETSEEGAAVPDEVDAVVFFEAVHHCDDPLRMLDRCRSMLRPGGQLVFLSEAVYEDFHLPWGVRLDEAAVTMARQEGWLELGFRRSFFHEQLLARGFTITEHGDPSLGPYGSLLVCRLGSATEDRAIGETEPTPAAPATAPGQPPAASGSPSARGLRRWLRRRDS
jgi:SAM-dependent methyltransferase